MKEDKIMMKNTKKNWTIAIALMAAVTAGNVATNKALIAKSDNEFDAQEKVMKNNLVWTVIGAIAGTVLHYTVIDR